MKSIQLINDNRSLFKLGKASYFIKVLSLLILVIFTTSTVLAQDKLEIIEFKQLSTENISKQFQITNTDAKKIKSLIVDLHPSVYLEDGKVNFYDEKPTTAFFDVEALNTPLQKESRFNTVEFVSIRINQSSAFSRINLANLEVFPNLKYVYFVCSVNCTENQIRNVLSGLTKNYIIIFRSENQS